MAMAAKVSFVQNRDYHSKSRSNGEKGCTHCDWLDGLNETKSRERRSRKDGDKNDGKVVVMVSTSTSLPTAGMALVSTEIGDSDLAIPRHSSSNIVSTLIKMDSDKDTEWVIYSGATYHMTFDQSLLQAHYKPHHSHVSNTNGVSSPISSVGTDLNHKEIIARGTKRGGLYYVDDENTWLSSTTLDQGILNQTVQQESEESPSPVPLVPTNNVPELFLVMITGININYLVGSIEEKHQQDTSLIIQRKSNILLLIMFPVDTYQALSKAL
ncbi:hypothetical protein KY285_023932 [Solanum tuberosum]|nr:hypothetical protein KY289_025781 [Solanum tuberosum]KAH0676131.1 hypothetical protein KY285_023932 [Solanum tuberosum]